MFSVKLALTIWHYTLVLQLNLNEWRLHARRHNHSVSVIVGPLGLALANWHAAAVDAAQKQHTQQVQDKVRRAREAARRGGKE